MHKSGPVSAFVLVGSCEGLVEVLSDEDDLNELSSKALYLINFLLWGLGWHENLALDLEFGAGESYTLGVVPCGGADNSLVKQLLRRRHHFVVGTSNFVASDHLQVFSLDEDIAVVFFGKGRRVEKRGVVGDSLEPLSGLVEGFDRQLLLDIYQ